MTGILTGLDRAFAGELRATEFCFCGFQCGATLPMKMLDGDAWGYIDKVITLSMDDGESTTVHVLDVDGNQHGLVVDVLASNRPYPERDVRAYTIRLGRVVSIKPAPAGLKPRRPSPAPDPCRTESSFSILALLLIVLIAVPVIFFLFMLVDVPLGIPVVSVIAYTAVMAYMTFTPQGGGLERYLLSCPVVRSQLRRLAWRHIGFLTIIVTFETSALYFRPHLPVGWFEASGRDLSPFTEVLFLLCGGLSLLQGVTNHSLLERAHLEYPSVSTPDPAVMSDQGA